ncbi:Long-chain-fatty-acid--CoA ligase 6 [Strongyloides ratti]|uniref:Long-chain-fatty-acid--CoA ligase n=1 Tax=Strongyloides ratti TaxID=34506 RepID=A0A090LI58_STRRB|nr:Long-chain-fatty-acid--CoA ligase 6 [Strongyloides ratti]CEF67818.1 Long-chain-fatty-acid--CoA ligase 6 [Strongyloides ratti]
MTNTRELLSTVLPSEIINKLFDLNLLNPVWSYSFIRGTLLSTSIAAFIYFIKRMSEKKILPPKGVSRDHQSVEVPGQIGVFKSSLLEKDEDLYIETSIPSVTTLCEAFEHGLAKRGRNNKCLGYHETKTGPYKWYTYGEVEDMAQNIGNAIVQKLGIVPSNDSHIGIYAINCPEWIITALGCAKQSIVVVPLYDTLGADAASFIVQQTEISVIVVDNLEKVNNLLENKENLPSLKNIIVIQEYEIDDNLFQKGKNVGVEILPWQKLESLGSECTNKVNLPKKDDTYIICYTSGTTGTPKGVILTHKNLVANMSGFLRIMDRFSPEFANEEHTIISFLPLSHMFEQVNHWSCLTLGFQIGYFRGKIQELTYDMKALKPTIFPAVPRLLNRFYDLIQKNVHNSGFIKRAIFNLAYNRKIAQLKRYTINRETIWDKLIFKKIQENIGGRVQYMITGSAPISAEVLETCRVALGATILEGYGQTECTALCTLTFPGDYTGGHTGSPAACNIIKLGDVPELNYFAKDRCGEVLIKGPNVTKGYYKNPEKTAELFNEEGFLQTGDIGRVLPDGTLKIIDRKKHILKLAQGEYVAPEKIENIYVRCDSVQQVFVEGDSLETYLIAIIVPDMESIKKWYHGHVKSPASSEDICNDPQTISHVLSELQTIGKEMKLNSIEQVKAIHIDLNPFTVENGLLTPTLKSKRPQLRSYYNEIIKELYKSTNATLAKK